MGFRALLQKVTRQAMPSMAAQYESHNREKGMRVADNGVHGFLHAHIISLRRSPAQQAVQCFET